MLMYMHSPTKGGMDMPITLKDVQFSFDELEKPLFEQVNLVLDTQWRLGLVGRNGRGKTTLLKLLMNDYAYSGTISSTTAFRYFPQKLLHPDWPVYTAIDEVMPIEQWKFERECQLLQLEKDIIWQPFEQLSGGEQTKVLLAALFCDEASYILLDEPTNHLDAQGRALLATYLKTKKGYLIVSHDRHFLDEVIDHVLAIERSQLVLYKGNFSTYRQQKAHQDHYELAQNERLKAEIHRLDRTAKEKAQWAASKEASSHDAQVRADAARMMKRSKAIEKRVAAQVTEKTKLLHNIESVSDLTMNCLVRHRNPVLRVKNLTLSYGDVSLFQPISFELYQGEQLAITGANGSGKTALLAYLFTKKSDGEVTGEVLISPQLTMSMVKQQYEYAGTLKAFAAEQKIDYTHFLTNLRGLGMERDVFNVPIERMSAGQKKKVAFAKSLGQPAELYLWDEPLNYLDIWNQQQIEKMLRHYKPTLLFVEHDPQFIDSVATKIVELKR